jgi:hypothetical protein
MTREEQGRDPQEVERPIASTRWSESAAAPDDELLPPFMPGRSRQLPAEHTPEPVDSQPQPEPSAGPDWAEAGPDWAEAGPEVVEPVSGGFVTDHQDVVSDTGETVTGQDEAVTEEEAFPFETPGAWDEPYSFDSDSQEAHADEPAAESWGEAMAEPWDAEETAAESWNAEDAVAEPWDAESAAEELWAADEPGLVGEEQDSGVDHGAAAELAQRLEDLAARIRTEGALGARAGMTSSDRLTALLSTLIAGYIEGREG